MSRLTILVAVAMLTACAARGPWVQGKASWYGPGFAGKPTASGQIFHPSHLTAAHRTLPFGTVVLVERTDNGKRVKVVVNDRGPYGGDRTIDLSRGAGRQLDMIEVGVAPVRTRVIGCKRSFDGPRGCASAS